MELNIVFGLRLDGASSRPEDSLGTLRLGPRGLLDFLELHSGLYAKPVSALERLGAFVSVLKDSEKDLPSFSASFKRDPLATAQRLLAWLDAWKLHGWDGTLPKEAPERVKELGFVARLAEGRVAPSDGDRLKTVADALSRGAKLPLLSIELCEELPWHPAAWHRVLGLLPFRLRDFEAAAPPGSDLGNLQSALAGGSAGAFRGDGSVRLFSAETRLGAARFLAGRNTTGESDATVIVGEEGGLWDEACAGQNSPRPAAFASNSERPALQLLPLALALHRGQCNLEALLAFLTHPVCPLGYESRYFASALAEDGGVGGPKWDNARKEALKSYAKYGKDEKRLDELLAQWIPSRRATAEELPLELACSVAGQVASYFRARLAAAESMPPAEAEAYGYAIAQCGLFEKVLRLAGASFGILPLGLVRGILATVSAAVGERPEGARELGSTPWVAEAGAIVEPVRKLVWLLPTRPESPEAWPWSQEETAALSSRGLELPSLSSLNARVTQDWIRAVSLAAEGMDLILPPPGAESHPLCLLLESLWPGLEPEAIEGSILLGTEPEAKQVERITLPSPERWWRLPRSAGPSESWEASYSQISIFIERPQEWVLKYLAKLETSDILSIPDRSALAGSFAHALVEDCIDVHGAGAATLGEEAFSAWYEKAFDTLLSSQGAAWLEAGAGQERLRLRKSLRRSIRTLLDQLRAAEAASLESEKALEGKLFGIPFTGKADLALKTASGHHAIIDMKNSYWLSGYAEKLETDTDIQLSIYTELYRQQVGAYPEVAYYLIPHEKLLARTPSLFAKASLVESELGAKARLERLGASVAWRRNQLEEGLIEVVCEATEDSDTKATAPTDAIPLGEPHDGFDPFIGVYGWREQE